MNKSPHLDRDWLYQKYVIEQLSTYDIGKLVNRNPKNIYNKLRDFNIPTRHRGENLAGGDNYMRQQGVSNPFLGKTHSDETRAILSVKASCPKPYLRGNRNGMSGRTGQSNPNYKDGSSPKRQSLYASGAVKDIIRKVYARDSYRCVRCGAEKSKPKSLHAHHIKSWAGNPELRFELSNFVTLCRDCHSWVHSRANQERDYLD